MRWGHRRPGNKLVAVVSISMFVPRTLQDVNLALNEVTEGGVDALAAFLQDRTTLQRLVLRENELGDDGALALAGALKVFLALQPPHCLPVGLCDGILPVVAGGRTLLLCHI